MEVVELEPTEGLERVGTGEGRSKPNRSGLVFEVHCPGIEPQKPSGVRRDDRDERSLEEGRESPNERNDSENAKEQRHSEVELHAFGKHGSSIAGPNGPKLSDGGRKSEPKRTDATRRSLQRLVRRVTAESGEREHASHRRGNEGAAAGKGRPKLATCPDRDRDEGANGKRRCPRSEREPTCLPKTERRGRAPDGLKLSGGYRRGQA